MSFRFTNNVTDGTSGNLRYTRAHSEATKSSAERLRTVLAAGQLNATNPHASRRSLLTIGVTQQPKELWSSAPSYRYGESGRASTLTPRVIDVVESAMGTRPGVDTSGSIAIVKKQILSNDRSAVLATVGKNGRALEYASEELKKDKYVVEAAVKQNGLALKYASEELKKDRDVVFTAVVKNGLALKYASDELKNDQEVVAIAFAQDWRALEFATQEQKILIAVALAGVKGALLEKDTKSNEIKVTYKDAVFAAVLEDFPRSKTELARAFKELYTDRTIVLGAVTKNGLALEYASEELKKDRDVVLAAVKQNGYALQFASEELKKDRDVVLDAVKKTGMRFSLHQRS